MTESFELNMGGKHCWVTIVSQGRDYPGCERVRVTFHSSLPGVLPLLRLSEMRELLARMEALEETHGR